MAKRKRHLKVAPKPKSRQEQERDEPVKLPDNFGEAIRAVLPVQATKAGRGSTDDGR